MGNKQSKEVRQQLEWDDVLPDNLLNDWKCWKDSLVELQNISIPRCYHPDDSAVPKTVNHYTEIGTAAVLSTQATKCMLRELTIEVNEIIFYTDSKVVLGYIQNQSRRFFTYVANRVQIIRQASSPEQWIRHLILPIS